MTCDGEEVIRADRAVIIMSVRGRRAYIRAGKLQGWLKVVPPVA